MQRQKETDTGMIRTWRSKSNGNRGSILEGMQRQKEATLA